MRKSGGPQPLSNALSELISLRNLAGGQGDAQLARQWNEVAGPKIAGCTRVLGLQRGVLQVGVTSSPMLSELVSFHKPSLLSCLQRQPGREKIRDIKFLLKRNVED